MQAAQKLTQLLGIRHPIVQAPMAGGITTPELVADVAKAGALGSFGAAYMTPDVLREAIRKVKTQTTASFQVNLFLPDDVVDSKAEHAKAFDKLTRIYAAYGLDAPKAEPKNFFRDHVDVVLAEKVPVVSFTFGVPDADILARLRKAGSIIIGTATCVAEAKALNDAKVDVIAAQGFEAGGHRCTLHDTLRKAGEIPNVGLFALLPHIVREVSVPVLASGGIMDGAGIVAALALGAAGAQLGTAFMGCPEAGLTNSWRAALKQSADTDTVLTKVFSGRAARGIRNKFMAEMAEVKDDLPPFAIQNALTVALRREAKRRDDPAYQSLWAGQAAAFTRSLPAGELVRVLVEEMAVARRNLSS